MLAEIYLDATMNGTQNSTLFISILLAFIPQIECSSISEYSERIIKANHLDSGKNILRILNVGVWETEWEIR